MLVVLVSVDAADVVVVVVVFVDDDHDDDDDDEDCDDDDDLFFVWLRCLLLLFYVFSIYILFNFFCKVYFDRACDVEENCTSDLNLTVNVFLVESGKRRSPYTSTTAIYLGGTETLEMEVDVTNLHDTAYNVNFTAMANVDLQDIRFHYLSIQTYTYTYSS